VFVAAHRAIALGLAAADTVFVKPSRREPAMTRLLDEAAPELFTVVDEIRPADGDVVFAYGADATLAAISGRLSGSVRFEGHGTGFGVGVVDVSSPPGSVLASPAVALAHDAVLFDQRGCLSPRLVLVQGPAAAAIDFAEALAQALDDAERRVPRGQLSADETAECVRYRDTMRYAGALYGSARSGWVGLDVSGRAPLLSPVGRNLHVVPTGDASAVLAGLSRWVTTIGVQGSQSFAERIGAAVPFARRSALGYMQRPPFDGPVDERGRKRARC